MKRFLLFLLLTLFSFSIYSQSDKPNSQFYKPNQITTDSVRYNYGYDSKGNQFLFIKELMTNGTFIFSSRETYTFDDFGNALVHQYEIFNSSYIWENTSKIISSFDNANNTQTEVYQIWSKDSWINSSQKLYTYDAAGNLTGILNQNWTNGAWQNDIYITFVYDKHGYLISFFNQKWANGSWEYVAKSEYLNDMASGKNLMITYYGWSAGDWVNSSRTSYTYDASYVLTSESYEIWNNGWESTTKFDYTYHSSGKLASQMSYNRINNSWEAYFMDIYNYDISGNLLSHLGEVYTMNGWVNSSRYTYTYDVYNNATHGESHFWKNDAWTPKLRYFYFNHLSILGSYFDADYVYYTGVGDKENLPDKFSLQQNYPNPFNPATTINYSLPKEGFVKLTVYDASGSAVANLVNEVKPAGNYSTQFNASGLASGVYFYRLESSGSSFVKKLILMK